VSKSLLVPCDSPTIPVNVRAQQPKLLLGARKWENHPNGHQPRGSSQSAAPSIPAIIAYPSYGSEARISYQTRPLMHPETGQQDRPERSVCIQRAAKRWVRRPLWICTAPAGPQQDLLRNP